jgi:hypothetical protein
MRTSFEFLLAAAAALATASAARAQAAFFPIPNATGMPAYNANGCYQSDAPRVSSDGSTVACTVVPAGASAGAVQREFAVWTEAGGTQVIAPDNGYGANFGWGVFGISSDGGIVYGADWVWRQVGGYQSLAGPLWQQGLASIFGCSDDGAVVAGVRPDPLAGVFPGDLFRWQVAQPNLQFLPRDAQFPEGYFLFNCISGDGNVVAAAAYNSGVPNGTYAGAIVTAAGSTLITPPSAGNATLVRDLSFDGSVAVGQASLPGPIGGFGLSSFRWTSAGGLQVLPVPGTASSANACSASGDVVVGGYLTFGSAAGSRAYVWTASGGVVDLQNELVANQGLGVSLQGWSLVEATDVSADGSTIVGYGINPSGCKQAFVVRMVPGGGAFAQTAAYGDGCNRRSASLYEYFALAAQYDLSNTTISFLPNGSGYTVLSGSAAYVPPSASATVLPFLASDEETVALPAPFPYPGGVTSSLVVCANGFVSAASGNGTAFIPNVGLHLNSPAACWRNWGWYDPKAPGSGSVTFETVNGVVYISWDGVFTYGLPFPAYANTFQFQFELATGIVRLVIANMAPAGLARLVGYSPGGFSLDTGDTDLSTALSTPIQLPAADQRELTLVASSRPLIGTSCNLVTSNVTGASQGLNLLSLGQIPAPGFDLDAFGAPGCRALVDIATSVANLIDNLPSTGPTLSSSLPIPNAATILGTAVYSQSLWLDATQNALGITTSNGITLVVGNF